MKRILVVFSAISVVSAAGLGVEEARNLYHLSEFDRSLKILYSLPQKDAEVWGLIGKSHYGQADFKKATEALEKAVAMNPGSSDLTLWLGRAYGRRAETSSVFTAPGYASKTRQYFEKATNLDPNNLEAQSDLLEYYLEAPGFLGGGLDKAAAVAAQIARINPSEGYWAQAKLAEKRKEYGTAEAHLRAAIAAAPQQVGRLLDLARLLTRQGRVQEADQSLAKAEKIAPNSPKVLFTKAELYVKSKRNLEEAKQLLRHYLSLTLTPDDPPKADAEKLLKQAQGS